MTLVASDLDFNSASRILNLPAPVGNLEPVRLTDLNSAIEGLSFKDNCRVATQSNINLAAPGATIDGITMAASDRVLVLSQTATSENGIYIWNGSAVAMTRSLDANTSDELESATVIVDEGSSAGSCYRQTSVNFTLGSSPVQWVVFGAATPPASTSTAGSARYATQGEVDAGTINNATVTPATLAGYASRIKKYSATIGDGFSTSYNVTHNLGTLDVIVQIYKISTGAEVLCDNTRTSTNTVTVTFATGNTPASNSYRVVVLG